jgi:hypothetical protein
MISLLLATATLQPCTVEMSQRAASVVSQGYQQISTFDDGDLTLWVFKRTEADFAEYIGMAVTARRDVMRYMDGDNWHHNEDGTCRDRDGVRQLFLKYRKVKSKA